MEPITHQILKYIFNKIVLLHVAILVINCRNIATEKHKNNTSENV